MLIRSLQGKRICILGFGREGQATLHAVQMYAPDAAIFIADVNPQQKNVEYPFITGSTYLENIDKQCFHTIIKSPGISPHPLFEKWSKEDRLTSATQIFFDSIAESGATVIGVTGSKGKSTTASLIYEILKKASCHPEGNSSHHDTLATSSTYLIGNIGTPALDFLDKAKPGVTFVMELSSYQLMDLTVSPHIAVITSFFPEHLDYHGSLDAYREAKSHIVKFQTKDDNVFYPSQSEGAYEIAKMSPGKKIPFSEGDAPVTLTETKLIGPHNLRNIAGAWKVAEYLGIPRDTAIKAIKEFHPLPHRLQSLGIHYNLEWIDDAISTTPESTIAALDALGDRVVTIILGGQDRGNDFTELAHRLKNSSVKIIILFPGSGPRIRVALEATHAHLKFFEAGDMEEAVAIAQHEAKSYKLKAISSAPIVLLSTASPSYNMFKNFEEKGEKFRQCIEALTHSVPVL